MVKAARTAQALALAAAFLAAPAAAEPPDLARWLAANTDLPAAQIAIAGPTHVYSLEPLGARTPAGEVIALVRTEPLAADWGAERGFQSWDAHLLFDCAGGRLRQIRAATYPQRNRKGAPTSEPAAAGWTSPEPDAPAARLLAAACDPAFVWALRPGETGPATAQAALPPPPLPAVIAAPAAPPPPAAPSGYVVQLARGPSEDGAQRALKAARKLLAPTVRGLTGATLTSQLGDEPRYTAILGGFTTAGQAARACAALAKAGQTCFARPAEAADAAA